ncbi:MAG: hypothetical protein HQL38_19440, partial [Alphaproteobacteria bacterium]|nr:hypothetical protein [Alphaproteobacteria bacterium]
MIRGALLLAALLLAAPAAAQDHGQHTTPPAEWSAAPRLVPKGGGRGPTIYVQRGLDTATITVLPPEGAPRTLASGAPVA